MRESHFPTDDSLVEHGVLTHEDVVVLMEGLRTEYARINRIMTKAADESNTHKLQVCQRQLRRIRCAAAKLNPKAVL